MATSVTVSGNSNDLNLVLGSSSATLTTSGSSNDPTNATPATPATPATLALTSESSPAVETVIPEAYRMVFREQHPNAANETSAYALGEKVVHKLKSTDAAQDHWNLDDPLNVVSFTPATYSATQQLTPAKVKTAPGSKLHLFTGMETNLTAFITYVTGTLGLSFEETDAMYYYLETELSIYEKYDLESETFKPYKMEYLKTSRFLNSTGGPVTANALALIAAMPNISIGAVAGDTSNAIIFTKTSSQTGTNTFSGHHTAHEMGLTLPRQFHGVVNNDIDPVFTSGGVYVLSETLLLTVSDKKKKKKKGSSTAMIIGYNVLSDKVHYYEPLNELTEQEPVPDLVQFNSHGTVTTLYLNRVDPTQTFEQMGISPINSSDGTGAQCIFLEQKAVGLPDNDLRRKRMYTDPSGITHTYSFIGKDEFGSTLEKGFLQSDAGSAIATNGVVFLWQAYTQSLIEAREEENMFEYPAIIMPFSQKYNETNETDPVLGTSVGFHQGVIKHSLPSNLSLACHDANGMFLHLLKDNKEYLIEPEGVSEVPIYSFNSKFANRPNKAVYSKGRQFVSTQIILEDQFERSKASMGIPDSSWSNVVKAYGKYSTYNIVTDGSGDVTNVSIDKFYNLDVSSINNNDASLNDFLYGATGMFTLDISNETITKTEDASLASLTTIPASLRRSYGADNYAISSLPNSASLLTIGESTVVLTDFSGANVYDSSTNQVVPGNADASYGGVNAPDNVFNISSVTYDPEGFVIVANCDVSGQTLNDMWLQLGDGMGIPDANVLVTESKVLTVTVKPNGTTTYKKVSTIRNAEVSLTNAKLGLNYDASQWKWSTEKGPWHLQSP